MKFAYIVSRLGSKLFMEFENYTTFCPYYRLLSFCMFVLQRAWGYTSVKYLRWLVDRSQEGLPISKEHTIFSIVAEANGADFRK